MVKEKGLNGGHTLKNWNQKLENKSFLSPVNEM